ncbi:MAG: hypothetical protein RJQ01_02890 [Microcella sp.]|uniref:hypothetical protein n=1 Tax=Microcella sp. TaxID=1913979 RepID=UPI0033154971
MSTHDRLAARRSRVAASWLVGVVATVTAATAHALGGGGTPSIAALATALVTSGLVGMLVIGARPSSPRILIGVAIDQAIFHSLFSFFAAAGASGTALGVVGSHAAHGAPLSLVAPATAAHHTASGPMVFTHIAAGAAAFLLVRFGLGALARALRTLALRVAAALRDAPAVVPLPRAPRFAPAAPIVPPLGGILERLELRRGPPAHAAV